MTRPIQLKECISGKATLQFYKKGFLHYECNNGFNFRVPIDDCGDGEFRQYEDGITLMRYIRKEIEGINESKD